LADEELVVLEEEVALADKELVEEVDEDEEGKRVSFWLEKEVDWVSITEIEVTEKIRKNFFLECHYFFNEKRKIFFLLSSSMLSISFTSRTDPNFFLVSSTNN
jgi:hypothetical protein